MNYPIWLVPYIGGGLVVGIVSIIHVFNSHFAVGGGAFLALTEHLAYKHKDERVYAYLKKHSLFFLLVTTVLGVVSGPGIWWSISLASPGAIETLIQQYTFLWAFEYVVFLTELATFFVYYYTWNRISRKLHLTLAWVYFGISILTLVTINGMLTFMLTPGRWVETHSWIDGYFNPTYWPSNFLRLLIMFGIAGMFALLTSARIRDPEFRTKMLRYSAKWLLPVFFLGPIIGYWYFTQIPSTSIETIINGIHSSGAGNFSVLARAIYLALILSGTVLIFAFVGPYLNPRGFTFPAAVAFAFCGFLVTGVAEWSREMLRKPYLIYGYMYSNGLLKDQVASANRDGYFNVARWPRSIVAQASGLGPIPVSERAQGATAPSPETLEQGRLMYQFQCQSCHVNVGYRSTRRLLGDRDLDGIRGLLATLRETDPKKNPYHGIMPPLVGTDDEVEALAQYLFRLNHSQGVAGQNSAGLPVAPVLPRSTRPLDTHLTPTRPPGTVLPNLDEPEQPAGP